MNELLGEQAASEPTSTSSSTPATSSATEQWIYRTQTAELEAELAERVHDLVDGQPATG